MAQDYEREAKEARAKAIKDFVADVGGYPESVICISCRQPIPVNFDDLITRCPYCRAEMPQMHELIRLSYEHAEEKAKAKQERKHLRNERIKAKAESIDVGALTVIRFIKNAWWIITLGAVLYVLVRILLIFHH